MSIFLRYRGIKSLEARNTEAIWRKPCYDWKLKGGQNVVQCCLFSDRCYDRAGKETCEWRVANGHDCKAAYMEIDCAATCGYCGER